MKTPQQLSYEELKQKFEGKIVRVAYNPKSDWPQKFDGVPVKVAEVVKDTWGIHPTFGDVRQIIVERPDQMRWFVNNGDVSLIDEEPTQPITKTNLYPLVCKNCKSYGRRINQTFFCSSSKCKSRKKVMKLYAVPKKMSKKELPHLPNSRDNPEKLANCDECGAEIRNLFPTSVICENGHNINRVIKADHYYTYRKKNIDNGNIQIRITKLVDGWFEGEWLY